MRLFELFWLEFGPRVAFDAFAENVGPASLRTEAINHREKEEARSG